MGLKEVICDKGIAEYFLSLNCGELLEVETIKRLLKGKGTNL
jgi:hypothetical protein